MNIRPSQPKRINIVEPQNDGIKYAYIGRPPAGGDQLHHFGNPFSHLQNSRATVVVASQQMAVLEFEKWIRGTAWKTLEQERRRWILKNLDKLEGRVLGCFCRENTRWCHGEIYLKLLEERRQSSRAAKKLPTPRSKQAWIQGCLFSQKTSYKTIQRKVDPHDPFNTGS